MSRLFAGLPWLDSGVKDRAPSSAVGQRIAGRGRVELSGKFEDRRCCGAGELFRGRRASSCSQARRRCARAASILSAMPHQASRPPRVDGGGPRVPQSSRLGRRAAAATRSGRVWSSASVRSLMAAVSCARWLAVSRMAVVQWSTARCSRSTRCRADVSASAHWRGWLGTLYPGDGSLDGGLVSAAPVALVCLFEPLVGVGAGVSCVTEMFLGAVQVALGPR